jgi:hypothetical protein
MSVNDLQVGGNHYKSAEDRGLPQHWDICVAMGWSYLIGAATKYIWRLDRKGGPDKAIQDLEKAIHYLQKELEVRKAEYADMEKDIADDEDYKSRFHGGNFPFSTNHTVGISQTPIMTLGDVIRKRIRDDGLEDPGDANSRYTNQG